MLSAADCNIWIKAKEQPTVPLVEEILQRRPFQVLELPPADEVLDAENVDPFPYCKVFEDAIQEPFCILHTSGTTNLPKPVVWSHGLIGTMDAVRLLPPTEGDLGLAPWTQNWNDGDKIYSAFPMSHVSYYVHPAGCRSSYDMLTNDIRALVLLWIFLCQRYLPCTVS